MAIHKAKANCKQDIPELYGLSVEEHAITRTAGPMEVLPVHFVDNVITTGRTMAACRRALGWGSGLAYADASSWPQHCKSGLAHSRTSSMFI